MVREPTKNEIIGLSYGSSLYEDLANDETRFWSCVFSLDDIDDF
jgi:hypothetical protein